MNRPKRHRGVDLTGDASDDEDYDSRPSPKKKPKKSSSKSRSRTKRRRRDSDDDDDEEDDDEDISEVSFEDESEEDESPVLKTQSGRAARTASLKTTKYNDGPDSDVDLPPKPESEDEEEEDVAPSRRSTSKPSLMLSLKLPTLRSRRGSKSVRAQSFNLRAMRANSQQAGDDMDHTKTEWSGTGTPKPITRHRTSSAKQVPHTSTVTKRNLDGSQEAEEPNAILVTDLVNEEPEEQPGIDLPENEDEFGRDIVAGTVHPGEDDEDEGPLRSRRRSQRISHTVFTAADIAPPAARMTRRTRRSGIEDTSDFDPAAEEAEDDEDMSNSESPLKESQRSENSSHQGRRSGRNAKKGSPRAVSADESDIIDLDADELAEEAAELKAGRRGGLRRRCRASPDVLFDQPKLRQREKKDYRIIRPELFNNPDDDDAPLSAVGRRGKGPGGAYRSLYSTQGPFGNTGGPNSLFGLSGGLAAAGGAASDSSDDEMVPKAPRGIVGGVGMTPTTAVGQNMFGPPTFNAEAVLGSAGAPPNVGQVKDKKLLADADPLGVDQNVNFDGVGGLGQHINQLKEMIMLPLLYPEIFLKMKIVPPRGVLFHGPPGTGKTLLARALASSVSSQGKKVTFYMRKGADALSKWVGEAEKQLRTLFEEARKTQPSIIFFDEIDGLAPVRSSKQEQIHASIVATLLALMDGMDGRGQVIVIGATNRPDSVDPALRRPGRFDREFYFPLPNVTARRAIIDIHTKDWDPKLKPEFKDHLADLTKGYGGADLRALCTEAALNAVQGTYPQIYESNEKLIIDPSKIKVLAKDFMVSVNKMIPSSERSNPSGAAPLETSVEPLLRESLARISTLLDEVLPEFKKPTALEEAIYDDRNDEAGFEREIMQQKFDRSRIFRPRLLVYGARGMGQQYIGGALLSKFERLHVQSFDLSVLYSESGRSPEAAVVQLFNEARRHKPSVIYIPNVDVWYNTIGDAVLRLFTGLLRSLPSNEPLLVLGIMELDPASQEQASDLSLVKDLFGFSRSSHVKLDRPHAAQRREYFQRVFDVLEMSPLELPDPANRKKRVLEVLERAPVIETAKAALTKQELKLQKKNDRMTLNWLKIRLQPIIDQLKKAYKRFVRPPIDPELFEYLFDEVDSGRISTDLPEDQRTEVRPYEMDKDQKGVPGIRETMSRKFYYNLELVTIERRFVNGYYKRPKDFLADIKRLVKDAKTSGDTDRIIKGNQMLANVETDVEVLERTEISLVAECEKVYARELEREHEQHEKALEAAEREGRNVPIIISNVPPEYSHTTTEASGAIVLGVPVPGRASVPGATGPTFARSPMSNGYHARSSGHEESSVDVEMSNTQDPIDQTTDATRLGINSQHIHPQSTPLTRMAPGSQAADYHNSASTTTSGKMSDEKSHQTQSTNGTGPVGHPDWSIHEGRYSDGTPLPDTQEDMKDPSSSSQSRPLSQFSQSSPPLNVAPTTTTSPSTVMPPPPRQNNAALTNLLNDPTTPPTAAPRIMSHVKILDKPWLQRMHDELVEASSGLSVEQLEQTNAALMSTVWHGRGDWNRTRLAEKVKRVFNETIVDIQECQRIASGSQEAEFEMHNGVESAAFGGGTEIRFQGQYDTRGPR